MRRRKLAFIHLCTAVGGSETVMPFAILISRRQGGTGQAIILCDEATCQKLCYIFWRIERVGTVTSLNEQILQHASGSPEGTVLFSKGLLHMGNRAAVDQSLSRLAKNGQLMRIGRYVSPVKTRFGDRPPDIDKSLESLSRQSGETIVPSGGSAAHALGVTTQVPVRPVYLTSGNSRNLQFGKITVELRHAPKWQLIHPNKMSGNIIRALASIGPEESEELPKLMSSSRLTEEDITELAESRVIAPQWIAESVSEMISFG